MESPIYIKYVCGYSVEIDWSETWGYIINLISPTRNIIASTHEDRDRDAAFRDKDVYAKMLDDVYAGGFADALEAVTRALDTVSGLVLKAGHDE